MNIYANIYIRVYTHLLVGLSEFGKLGLINVVIN